MLVEQADDSLRVRRGKIRREVNAQRVRRIEIRHVLHRHGEHVRQRNVLARVAVAQEVLGDTAGVQRVAFACRLRPRQCIGGFGRQSDGGCVVNRHIRVGEGDFAQKRQ